MGAVEVALIFALRAGLSREITWPVTMMAVLSAMLLSAGVSRHYWDIYVHRTVRGISFLFVAIDALGDLTSLLSILFQPRLDVLGMVIYGSELMLWIGIFVAGGYFNLLPWARRKVGGYRSRSVTRSVDSTRGSPGSIQGEGDHARGLALHDMPSSTSVFRTPSGELAVARARVGVEGRSEQTGED